MRKSAPILPKKELSAPFWMISFSDMVSLMLAFFVLLFSLSTLQKIKFEAQVGVVQGSLGISKFYMQAPIQDYLPAPSVKQTPRKIAVSSVKPTSLLPLAEYARKDLTEPVQHQENEKLLLIEALGVEGSLEVVMTPEEIVIVLPTFGIFEKNSYKVDVNSPRVQKVTPLYAKLSQQIASLPNYDVYFVGHTDSLVSEAPPGGAKVISSVDLGFRRALSTYDFFFNKYLKDKTRITFASQGDNVPIVPYATLDSERRMNRRVEILLKRKKTLQESKK